VNGSIAEDRESLKASIMSTEYENETNNGQDEDFQILTGHTSDVNSVDISSNSQFIVSGSNDSTVRIWKLNEDGTYGESTQDPPFISPITEHSYGVNCVRFSPFSTILATASTDGKIILWSTQTGKENFTLYHPSENAIRCLAFSPNSELLATGSDDETCCIWDLRTRLLLKCLRGPETMITSIIFTNDSLNIIAGSSNGDLWYWQASGLAIGKKLSFVPQAHDLGVSSLDFSNGYQSATSSNDSLIRTYIMASAGNDDLIKIWLVKYCQIKSDIKLLNVLKGHESNVNCVKFSSNGDMLVSASGDKTIKIWNVAKGQIMKQHSQHTRFATCVTFSNDDRKVISGSNDRSLVVWEMDKDEDKLKHNLEENEESPEEEREPSNSESRKAELKVQNTINNLKTNTNQVSHWTKEQVISWLKTLDLEDCVEIFEANEIDGLELLHLTHDSLQLNLRIDSLGKRNKILRAIQSLKNPFWQHLSLLTDENLSLPEECYCPITHEFMIDPVVAFDGYSYEKAAIQEWFKKGNNTSPMTNELLSSNQLLPNHTLKLLIKKYLASD